MELIQNVTSLSQQYGVQDSCIELPRASVHRFDFNLNVGRTEQCGYGATSTCVENPHHALTVYGKEELDNNARSNASWAD